MIKVRARPTETPQQLIARFKRACTNEGLIKQIKKASFYEKPSEKRRNKIAKSKARLRQAQARVR